MECLDGRDVADSVCFLLAADCGANRIASFERVHDDSAADVARTAGDEDKVGHISSKLKM